MKKLLVSLVVLFVSQMMSAQNISNGYRFFIDGGYTVGIGDYKFGRFELNVSNGYQINPFFFVGGGLGVHFMSKYETKSDGIPLDLRKQKTDIPVFANLRADFAKGKVTPFVDGKAGYFLTNNGGVYLNLSAGCRIAVNEQQAVNVSIGYTSEELEFETFKGFVSSKSMDYTRSARKLKAEGIAIKIGFEF
jgi:hypothetical protein